MLGSIVSVRQLLYILFIFCPFTFFNILKNIYYYLSNEFKEKLKELICFYDFICENNPLLLDYSDEIEEHQSLEYKDENETIAKQKYEDKYLEKFEKFPNKYNFTEDELNEENDEYFKISLKYEEEISNEINSIKKQLLLINEIQEKGNIKNNGDDFTKDINEFGFNALLNFYEIEKEDYKENSHDFDIEELYMDLLKDKDELLKKMDEIEKTKMTEDDMRKKAHEIIINKKLDKYINNYILEFTPLGNVYMRYNNNKKSFEYFSDRSIPYRYLEPLGRKYVTTYWCKPLFINIEEELKKSEKRFEEKKMEEKKQSEFKRFSAQFKKYNNASKESTMRPMKNRTSNQIALPSQVKANLPDVNKISEKILLKENANRYTWEGRLTNFCPLKKIDKKILNKKLSMTYSDFKKLSATYF